MPRWPIVGLGWVGVSVCAVMLRMPGLAAEPITPVTARATSTQVAGLFGPQNLCTDVGLTPTGDGGWKLTTDSFTGGGCMWHSGYLPQGGDENPIVEFDFGRIATIGRMQVWNYNAAAHRGFREVALMISDDGQHWRPIEQRFQFAKAPQRDDYIGETYEFRPVVRGRYLRFFCESTHRVGGNRELAGLGKVRFYEADGLPAPVREVVDFPIGAGVVNVQQAPYHAKGDGVADDTAALQRAIDDWQGTRRIVYLPRGTYRLTRSLRYQPGKGYGYNNLSGAGVDATILKLQDGTFTDPQKPQPVLTLGFNGQPDGTGVHADWFNNNVSRFTIDTGRNPGAIGLQYYSNNVGAARDLVIQGGGVIGLDLGYADQNGPCLLKNIRIDDFTTGVRTAATVNSQTAEHITIRNPIQHGWLNNGQCLAIRGLNCIGGPGLFNGYGVVSIIDSEFHGPGESAIRNHETLFARNIRTRNFPVAIDNRRESDQPTPGTVGPRVEEWVSTKPLSLFPGSVRESLQSLNLPIRETPEPHRDPPATWANIRAYRQLTDPDDSAALQRAIDSGASTIFFPTGGTFFFGQPVELKPTLRRLACHFATILAINRNQPAWVVRQSGGTLAIEDFTGHLLLEATARSTLTVRNGQGLAGRWANPGELYLENVVGEWDFSGGQIWARQHNNEREGTHITNAGATVWILGLKTERGGTLIATTTGGQTEVIGGLCYTTTQGKLAPMFTLAGNSRLSVSLGEVCYTGDPYRQLVEESRGGERRVLTRNDVPLRPAFVQGSQLPLFVAR